MTNDPWKSVFSDSDAQQKIFDQMILSELGSYDDPINKEIVTQIQNEANKTLDKQSWTVIERIGDGCKR